MARSMWPFLDTNEKKVQMQVETIRRLKSSNLFFFSKLVAKLGKARTVEQIALQTLARDASKRGNTTNLVITLVIT